MEDIHDSRMERDKKYIVSALTNIWGQSELGNFGGFQPLSGSHASGIALYISNHLRLYNSRFRTVRVLKEAKFMEKGRALERSSVVPGNIPLRVPAKDNFITDD